MQAFVNVAGTPRADLKGRLYARPGSRYQGQGGHEIALTRDYAGRE
jgi:hypothetical protein